MPTYVFLANFTDEGIRAVEDTTTRARKTVEIIERHGGTAGEVLWTQGQYDVVMTAEAPDDEAVAAMALAISRQGFLRTTTLRAYRSDEMDRILGRFG